MSASLGLSFSCLRSCLPSFFQRVWDAVSLLWACLPSLSSILFHLACCVGACVPLFNLVLSRLSLRWSGICARRWSSCFVLVAARSGHKQRNRALCIKLLLWNPLVKACWLMVFKPENFDFSVRLTKKQVQISRAISATVGGQRWRNFFSAQANRKTSSIWAAMVIPMWSPKSCGNVPGRCRDVCLKADSSIFTNEVNLLEGGVYSIYIYI